MEQTEKLYHELYRQLTRFFARRVASAETAEDLAQETFLKLLRRLKQGTTLTNPQAYLFQAARSMLIDHYRTNRTTEPVPELSDHRDEELRNEESRREIAGWMRRFIAQLPEPYRATLLLSELRGLPYAEISRRLGVTVGTVKSRVHRGRKLLKESLITCCSFAYDARGRVVDYTPHAWKPSAPALGAAEPEATQAGATPPGANSDCNCERCG